MTNKLALDFAMPRAIANICAVSPGAVPLPVAARRGDRIAHRYGWLRHPLPAARATTFK